MHPSSENNKRIAKNTIYLYTRMIFQLVVGLYTSRVILNALGIIDFGIYNIVGGVVAMLSFINGSMGAATTRFLTFELGKRNDPIKMRQVFSTALFIHLGVCVLFLLIGEVLGLWYIYNKLVFPIERLNAVLWVFQFSMITSLIAIINVPYNAVIISHEKMNTFAYLSIYEVVMQLVIAIIVKFIPADKLISYGFALMLVQLSIVILYRKYCILHFKETRGKIIFDSKLSKEMIRFAFWIMNGSLAFVSYTQGLNLLLNLFFGPAINAARGIAVTVQTKVTGFCNNFQMAINPQITKSYAADNFNYTHELIYNASKYSLYLVFLLSFPLILETDYILKIWLGIVPSYTATFVRLTLLIGIIDALRMPLITAIHATGRIKLFQLIEGSSLLLILPISYFFLKFGASPVSVFVVQLIIFILVQIERVFIVCPAIYMKKKKYLKNVVWDSLKVIIPAMTLPIILKLNPLTTNTFLSFIISATVAVLSTVISIYFIGLKSDMRMRIKTLIMTKIHIKLTKKIDF